MLNLRKGDQAGPFHEVMRQGLAEEVESLFAWEGDCCRMSSGYEQPSLHLFVWYWSDGTGGLQCCEQREGREDQ